MLKSNITDDVLILDKYQPLVPSYLVGISVAAVGVIIVLVISSLYYYLVNKQRDSSVEDAREGLREADTHLNMECQLEMDSFEISNYINPKPRKSIFREGEFLMEVLQGIDNINIHIDDVNSDISDHGPVIVECEETDKDNVCPQLEITLPITSSLCISKPEHNSSGNGNGLEMSGHVGDECDECGCPCPAIVLSDQYPAPSTNHPCC